MSEQLNEGRLRGIIAAAMSQQVDEERLRGIVTAIRAGGSDKPDRRAVTDNDILEVISDLRGSRAANDRFKNQLAIAKDALEEYCDLNANDRPNKAMAALTEIDRISLMGADSPTPSEDISGLSGQPGETR